MNNDLENIPEQLMDRIFKTGFEELNHSEQEMVLAFMDKQAYSNCYKTVKLIESARVERPSNIRLKNRIMSDYRRKTPVKRQFTLNYYLKIAAVLLILLSGNIMIRYFANSNSNLFSPVSGADTVNHNNRPMDSVWNKRVDSIQDYKKDSILSFISEPLEQIIQFERHSMRSLDCLSKVPIHFRGLYPEKREIHLI